MKKAYLAGGGLFLLAALGAALQLHYTGTPEYSLAKVRDAVRNHDLTAFQRYVDSEGVVSRLIDQILGLIGDGEESQSALENWGQLLGKGIINLLKPQLTNLVEEQIEVFVETGTFELDRQLTALGNTDFSVADIWNRVGINVGQSFRGVRYVNKEGKIAYVGLGFHNERFDTTLIVDIKLRNKGRYWQVAELSNVSDIYNIIISFEANRVEQLNKPIIEGLRNSFAVLGVTKSTRSDDWGISKKIILEVTLKNNTDKEIKFLEYTVECRANNGQHLKDYRVSDIRNWDYNVNYKPGIERKIAWEFDVNMFDTEANLLYAMDKSELDMDITVNSIQFTDGTILRKVVAWED